MPFSSSGLTNTSRRAIRSSCWTTSTNCSRQTYDVTREQIGGLEVVQALRAVAPLQEVRLASHRLVADQFATTVAELLARPVDELLKTQARLSIDTGYAIVEMALEDQSLPTDTLLREGSRMIQLYWQEILASHQAL